MTLFSPNSVRPACIAARTVSARWVFVTAINSIASALRPDLRAAVAMVSRMRCKRLERSSIRVTYPEKSGVRQVPGRGLTCH
jgi:hypothetical protein